MGSHLNKCALKGETAQWNMTCLHDMSDWYMKPRKNSTELNYLMRNWITYKHQAQPGKRQRIRKKKVMQDGLGGWRWWVVSYKPMLEEIDCGCGWSCPWCGTDCVWGWCSAGQMVLVGRWVNNDVSPQCSNYLLPGPCCSPHRLCECIRMDAITQKWIWVSMNLQMKMYTYIYFCV